jgi:hypothetical protein
MGSVIFCVCGKLCTSRPGLTLHIKRCKDAQKAICEGKPYVKDSTDIIIPKAEYSGKVKQFSDLAESIAMDAHLALSEQNKSAGRRARTNMITMRDLIIPMRKDILDMIKTKNGDDIGDVEGI